MLYQFHIAFTAAGMWYPSMAQCYFTVAYLEFLEESGLTFSKIGANLYQEKATNTVKHNKNLEYTPYSLILFLAQKEFTFYWLITLENIED